MNIIKSRFRVIKIATLFCYVKGQAIPAGLHVRLDLETGLKEAKLNEEDDGFKYWEKDGHKGMVNTESKAFSTDELKLALKHFKLTQDDVRQGGVSPHFKSYVDTKIYS